MNEKLCFVIAPIGDAESDTRKRSDLVLKHIIAPAVSELGYKAIRADQMSEPGMITSQVIQQIVDAALVVADLTERNPNVFYELAIRHAIRKPLVQLIRKGDAIPFDVAGTRTIHVDHRDLDSAEAARLEIQAQVKSLEADPTRLETPITVALDLQVLRASTNPEQRSMGDVLAAITELRSAFGSVEEHIKRSEMIASVALRDTLARREAQSEHAKFRLAAASRELSEVAREIAILSDTPDKERSTLFSGLLAKLQKAVAVLPEP